MIVVDVRDMPSEQWRLGVETRMLVSASNGAAQLCMFEQWIAPGAGAPTHSHPVEEVLTVRVDGSAAHHRVGRTITDRAGGASARLP
jgi:quercetin dioxygenase-like cupin family protein